MYKLTKKNQPNRSFIRPAEFPLKFGSNPFKGEKKIPIMGFMVFKSTGLDSRSQQKKSVFEKYAPSPEISAKMCQILGVWFGRPIFDTFLVISWDFVLKP